MLITLWVSLISKGHNSVWLGRFRIEIKIHNKNFAAQIEFFESLKSEDRAFLKVIQAFHTVRIILYIGCSGPVVECLNKINMLQSTTRPLGQITR